VFRKHARRTLGCQRVGKTLAFYGVKAGYRGIEIETVVLGVAGDNSRSTAGNFDDIGVGHVSFLLLASVSTQSSGHKPLALVGIDYGFVHCVGAGNAAAIDPNEKQAYRCDPLGVVAKERHPDGVSCVLPLRAQSTILASQSALDLVRRDGD